MKTHSTTSFHKIVRPRGLTRWVAGAAVALSSVSVASAQPAFFVTELPTPAGYEFSVPYQINDQGFVVGSSTRASDGQTATVWKGGTVQVLGRINHGTYSQANAINS